MLYGARLLQFVGFPAAEVLGPDASEDQINALIARYGSIFVKSAWQQGIDDMLQVAPGRTGFPELNRNTRLLERHQIQA